MAYLPNQEEGMNTDLLKGQSFVHKMGERKTYQGFNVLPRNQPRVVKINHFIAIVVP